MILEKLKAHVELARDLEKKSDVEKAIDAYRGVIFSLSPRDDDGGGEKKKPTAADGNEETKIREQAIDAVSHLYAKKKDARAIKLLVDELKPLFEDMPKAKTAKIVRNLIDVLASLEGFDELQVELCQEQIAWSKKEKRTFLRHRVELRLAALYLKSRRYTDSLRIISSLAREVKKLDDKLLLVDIHLVESKIHFIHLLIFVLFCLLNYVGYHCWLWLVLNGLSGWRADVHPGGPSQDDTNKKENKMNKKKQTKTKCNKKKQNNKKRAEEVE